MVENGRTRWRLEDRVEIYSIVIRILHQYLHNISPCRPDMLDDAT
jgi:hypothetical protein